MPATGFERAAAAQLRLRPGDIQLYRACEGVTEVLLYVMLIFGPWAFGTTQPWSIRLMNIGGVCLGVLLMVKLGIRRLKGYEPARWGAGGRTTRPQDHRTTGPEWLTMLLAFLTVALLAYCLTSAVNARVVHRPPGLSPEYRVCIQWLPHSLDGERSWAAFWTYLGLACLFWALRDWLLGKTRNEEAVEKTASPQDHRTTGPGNREQRTEDREQRTVGTYSEVQTPSAFPEADKNFQEAPIPEAGKPRNGEALGGSLRQSLRQSLGRSGSYFPERMRRLLWVLAINGGLLALEAIIQRLEGSGKLLFLVKPRINPGAHHQLGPWAYRSNAAQYFNLLWPVCLAFWWTLQRARGSRHNAHHLVLASAALMAACPIISASRGGALVAVAIAVLAATLLVASQAFGDRRQELRERIGTASASHSETRHVHRPDHSWTLAALVLFFTAALSLGFILGWKTLRPRMARAEEGLEGREQMYELIRPMAEDYPVFGTGPGTFATVFQDYPTSQRDSKYSVTLSRLWPPAQVHNDWLETRITFGLAGSVIIVAALSTVAVRWFFRGGIHGGRRFMFLVWLAMAGCLVHARFDFPFQIHSILALFIAWCAVIFDLSRRG